MKIWRPAWRFIFVGALVALGLTLCGAMHLRRAYERDLIQRIWPAESRPVPVTVTGASQFHQTILLFGDSRIAEWSIDPPLGTRIINAGLPGGTTAELRLELPKLLDQFNPDCLVLQAGINDLKLLGIKPGLSAACLH